MTLSMQRVRSAYLVADSQFALSALPSSSVGAVVTSPPYMAAKEYEEGWTWEAYWRLMSSVIAESYRVLLPGGWLCINMGMTPMPLEPGETEKVQQSGIPHRLWAMMQERGFLMDADIIWLKAAPKGPGQWRMWGSFPYPSKIYVQYGHEYILRGRVRGRREVPEAVKEASRLTNPEFTEWAQGVWKVFPLNRSRELKHPAPWPVEIPYRLIRMHSFVGDVIVDPFTGSAGTQLAAASCGRHSLGVEKHEQYWPDARHRCGGSEFIGYSNLRRFDDPAGAVRYVFDGGVGPGAPADEGGAAPLPLATASTARDPGDDIISA